MSAYRPSPAQFAGCLIGQCLGDALGFPVEGQPRAVCARYIAEALHPENTAPRGRAPFPFGQYTDDSQLARELMLSLVERRGFDPADYAQRIALIFTSGRIVGRGRATSEAAFRLAQGTPWTESGTPAPSAGNGSAPGTVVTRWADRTESTFPLGEVDHVSIASDHLPAEQVSRHGWTVGDPVRHAEFGLGVMQSFPAGDDVAAVVRFARCGETALSPSTAPLERLRLASSGSGPERYRSRVQPGD